MGNDKYIAVSKVQVIQRTQNVGSSIINSMPGIF
jgi:hypothetical protein